MFRVCQKTREHNTFRFCLKNIKPSLFYDMEHKMVRHLSFNKALLYHFNSLKFKKETGVKTELEILQHKLDMCINEKFKAEIQGVHLKLNTNFI